MPILNMLSSNLSRPLLTLTPVFYVVLNDICVTASPMVHNVCSATLDHDVFLVYAYRHGAL